MYCAYNRLFSQNRQVTGKKYVMLDVPAMYCGYNRLVSQDRHVVGKKYVMLTFCYNISKFEHDTQLEWGVSVIEPI